LALLGAFALPMAVVSWQSTSTTLTAAIYPGSCRKPQTTAAYSLTNLTKPAEGSGGVRGLPFVSETTVAVGLPALQSDSFALIVARDANHPDNAVACGDLNRATAEDGAAMFVGLFEQSSSLHTGVATLTAEGEQTIVRVYVARALNGGLGIESPFGGGGIDQADVTISVAVTIEDDELTVDQAQLVVGDVVEFVVINEGDDPHEAILEERGALEVPLENEVDEQTESEDLGPKEEARFIYRFEETGRYQLADHIGDNYDCGLVAEIEVVNESP